MRMKRSPGALYSVLHHLKETPSHSLRTEGEKGLLLQQEECRSDTRKNFQIVRVSTLTSRTQMFPFSGCALALDGFFNTGCQVQTEMEVDSITPYSTPLFLWYILPVHFPSCSAF